MANLGTFTKQPREIIPVTISYACVIDGRTVDSLTIHEIDTPTGMVLESSTASLPNQQAQLYISGGTDGQTYSWTVLVDVVIGGQTTRVEDEFVVQVGEVTPASTSGYSVASPFGSSGCGCGPFGGSSWPTL